MRFLLDSNLPASAANIVRAVGHEAIDVIDIGLDSAPDEQISAEAKRLGAAIVSRDFDFSDIRNYPPVEYFGIVVLELPETANARQICDVLKNFVIRDDYLSALPGRLAIVSFDRVRFRPRLDQS